MWKENLTNYTEEANKVVMLTGVGDEDISRKVLSNENILSRSSFEIISFIKSKEIGRLADMQQRTFGMYQPYLRFNNRKSNILM